MDLADKELPRQIEDNTVLTDIILHGFLYH